MQELSSLKLEITYSILLNTRIWTVCLYTKLL